MHGRDPDLAHGHDAQDRRRNAAARYDVHSTYLLIYLLQFCGCSGVVLHCTEPLQHLAILPEPKTTHANSRKSRASRESVAQEMMTPKELLDTLLGFLGFVVQIE